MHYDLFQHRHNFAVWGAARAVQRGWAGATSDVLMDAIEYCGVKDFAKDPGAAEATRPAFKAMHEQWCDSIGRYLIGRGLSADECTFGRAAKMIAVYLKGMIVTGGFDQLPVADLIHPPIDSILLKTMADKIDHPAASEWRKRRWRKLGKDQYYRLVDQLASTMPAGERLWKLEQHWNPKG